MTKKKRNPTNVFLTEQPKWKKFEKLVAAIHLAEDKGAVIKWNDNINGNQFDVTIRFKAGQYEYLTVIECRDHASSIKKDAIFAFVTKSQDAKASKAIFVSTSGFQIGAKKAAEKYNIPIYTVRAMNKYPTDDIIKGPVPVIRMGIGYLTNPRNKNTVV